MMTTGCKIWLWIMLVANAISLVLGIISFSTLGVIGIYTIVAGIIAIVGICLLLFKKKRIGFYILLALAVVGLVVNIANGANIAVSILSATIAPALTFFFISKNQSVIK